MKKNERETFKQLQDTLKLDINFRGCDSEKCLSFIVNNLIDLYNNNKSDINFKLAIDNLNEYSANLTFITDDPDLFDGSFKINGCFDRHIFGSTRNLKNLCWDVDDLWYTSEDFRSDICHKLFLNDNASKLFTYILVDIYANGLINVDIRNNQPARNILNDINYIIQYMYINYNDFTSLNDTISMLTFNKFNVIDAINYKRYNRDTNTDELLDVILDFNN